MSDFAGSPMAHSKAYRTCDFRHENIDKLFGVPPMAIEDLPKVCTCGMPITYAKEVAFVNQVSGSLPDLRPVPDAAWCYPPHEDDDWRLCEGAKNAWIGTIETKGGDDVLDLSDWACTDFASAFAFARATVRAYNELRFGIHIEDYGTTTRCNDVPRDHRG